MSRTDDLIKMLDDTNKLKLETVDSLNELMTMSPEEVKACGYATRDDGILHIVKTSHENQMKLTKAYVRKYPD